MTLTCVQPKLLTERTLYAPIGRTFFGPSVRKSETRTRKGSQGRGMDQKSCGAGTGRARREHKGGNAGRPLLQGQGSGP
eukprot:4613964-Amphidinium_carterae.1